MPIGGNFEEAKLDIIDKSKLKPEDLNDVKAINEYLKLNFDASSTEGSQHFDNMVKPLTHTQKLAKEAYDKLKQKIDGKVLAFVDDTEVKLEGIDSNSQSYNLSSYLSDPKNIVDGKKPYVDPILGLVNARKEPILINGEIYMLTDAVSQALNGPRVKILTENKQEKRVGLSDVLESPEQILSIVKSTYGEKTSLDINDANIIFSVIKGQNIIGDDKNQISVATIQKAFSSISPDFGKLIGSIDNKFGESTNNGLEHVAIKMIKDLSPRIKNVEKASPIIRNSSVYQMNTSYFLKIPQFDNNNKPKPSTQKEFALDRNSKACRDVLGGRMGVKSPLTLHEIQQLLSAPGTKPINGTRGLNIY